MGEIEPYVNGDLTMGEDLLLPSPVDLSRLSRLTLDTLIQTHPSLPPLPPQPQREQSPVRGERVCFCGWVQLYAVGNVVGTPGARKEDKSRRCWAEIRDHELVFKESDESTKALAANLTLEMHRCELILRSRERSGEVVMLFKELSKKQKTLCQPALRVIQFVPEDLVDAWLLLLSKVTAIPP